MRIYYPKYKQRYAFNTGNPGLQQYLAQRVVETLESGLYDGIQLDNVSTQYPFFDGLVGRWISSVPVNLTRSQWTLAGHRITKIEAKRSNDRYLHFVGRGAREGAAGSDRRRLFLIAEKRFTAFVPPRPGSGTRLARSV